MTLLILTVNISQVLRGLPKQISVSYRRHSVMDLSWRSAPEQALSSSSGVTRLLSYGTDSSIFLFCRFDSDADNYVEHIVSVSMTDRWITSVAWTSWRSLGLGECWYQCFQSLHKARQLTEELGMSTLACATSDGTVILLKVKQTLKQATTSAHTHHHIETTTEVLDDCPSGADKRSITGLSWAQLTCGQVSTSA